MSARHIRIDPAHPPAPTDVQPQLDLDFDFVAGHIECPDCDAPLDLSQPDVDAPDRLVGCCPDCRQLFAATRSPESPAWDWSTHLLERLPSRDARTAAPI